MGAIIFKELKSYFKSMFGWIFLAVFTFFAGLYYLINNIYNGSPYISVSMSSMIIVLIFILPLLTMRIISEEKRQKTDQFLITSPIPLWKVVLGKFLSIAIILFAASMLFLIGTVLLSVYGNISWIQALYSILIFFVFSCALASVGIFMSSITEHQFLAAIYTYFVFIFTLLAPQFCYMIFGSEKLISKILRIFDIYSRFDNLMAGKLCISDLLYLLSVIAIFIILSYKVFAKDSVQISAMGKNRFFFTRLGGYIVVVAIVALNVGSTYVPTKYTEFDISDKKLYSISDESKEVLKDLDKDVVIYVLAAEGEADSMVRSYLNTYDSCSKHVSIEYKPMDKYPMFYQDYCDTAPYADSLIVCMGDDYRVLGYEELYEYTYDYYSGTQSVVGSNIESLITSTIVALKNGENKVKAYALAGHNELPIPTYITETLSKNGFVFEDLLLVSEGAVPEDCDILFINGPMNDLTGSEVDAIKAYADNAGNIVMTPSLSEIHCENYDGLINSLGVTITEGTVLEGNAFNQFEENNPAASLNRTDDDSPFVISDKKAMLLYMSRGFKYDTEALPSDTSVKNIITSSKQSYEKIVETDTTLEKDDTCEDGPFSLGVYIRKYSPDAQDYSNIIIIGSPTFMYDQFDYWVANGNSELIVSAVSKVLPNNLLTIIPTKYFDSDIITVSMGVLYLDILFCEVILPLFMIIAGVVIAISRRRK